MIKNEIARLGWELKRDGDEWRAEQGNFQILLRKSPEEVLVDVRKLKGKNDTF